MNRPRPHQGGRPASSRTVRLVPLRRTGLDHRELARILLAITSSNHNSSGDNPATEGTGESASSARSKDPTTPASEGTTAASAASAGSSAGRGVTEERRS